MISNILVFFYVHHSEVGLFAIIFLEKLKATIKKLRFTLKKIYSMWTQQVSFIFIITQYFHKYLLWCAEQFVNNENVCLHCTCTSTQTKTKYLENMTSYTKSFSHYYHIFLSLSQNQYFFFFSVTVYK